MPKTVKLKETVLIVDDDPDVRGFLSETLRSDGYLVLEASSGPEALDVCAAHRHDIDLLLTDLIMPGMTGRMLADILAGQCPLLRVVFMSGYVDGNRSEDWDEDIRFLQKPFEPDRLKVLINNVLRKKRKSV